jgi:hypothetical protein
MKTKWLGIVLIGIVASLNAFAGDKEGNGGDALLINGKPYLLDLVEHGIEKSPYFDSKVAIVSDVDQGVEKAFTSFSVPKQLLKEKLSELYATDEAAAIGIVGTMVMYDWSLVDTPLVDINDVNSPLEFPAQNLVQLAVRLDRSISIRKDLWEKLDDANKTALLFHEALYALVLPQDDGSGKTKFQDSGLAREMVGELFSPPNTTNRSLSKFAVNGTSVLPFYTEGLIFTVHSFYSVDGEIGFNSDPFVQISVNEANGSEMSRMPLGPQIALMTDSTLAAYEKETYDESFETFFRDACSNPAQNQIGFVAGPTEQVLLQFAEYQSKNGQQAYMTVNFRTLDDGSAGPMFVSVQDVVTAFAQGNCEEALYEDTRNNATTTMIQMGWSLKDLGIKN